MRIPLVGGKSIFWETWEPRAAFLQPGEFAGITVKVTYTTPLVVYKYSIVGFLPF